MVGKTVTARLWDDQGKTMMEILVVTALVGMVAAMAVPNFLMLQSRMNLYILTQEVASELRLARQLAMTERNRIRIVFDLDQQMLMSQAGNGRTPSRIYRYGGKGIQIDEPSGGVEIVFHPSGRSATPTTIHLRGKDGHVHTLTVGITGRVSVL
jgi:type IV fimbrial biogenesis protein FimT